MQKKSILRKKLSELKIDGIVISDPVNVKYMTGFQGSLGYIILTGKHSLFITDFRYQEQAAHEVKGYKIVIERSERSEEIKDLCNAYKIRNLGFEENNITYGAYRKLLKRKIKLSPLNNIVESLRVVKTEEEIAYIKTAVKRAESAFRKLQPYMKTGVTELKLARRLEDLLRKEGCKTLPFEVIVASGPMSALPHAQPTNRKIKKGDLLVIDWGGECKGYYSDMTRTMIFKDRDVSKQKELYYNVLAAQEKAIRTVRSGIKSSKIDDAARGYIKQKGYDEFFGHGTGHGVGLLVHEKPVISWRNKEIIKENMIFTVEPGIYLPGFGGVRIEDMVVAGKMKAEVLTSLPKKLKIIER